MNKGEDRLSPEESALLETMAILVEAHDDRHYPLPPRPPHEMRGYRGTPFRGGIPGKGRRNCSGTMAPMTNRIHSFDRVPLFERQGFWGLGQWRRNLHKVSPPHPLFQRAPFPGAGRRNRQQRGWNGRIGARRPAGFPLMCVNPAAA